jgi:hypothetical protein
MNAPNADSKQIPLSQAIAYIVGICTIVLPPVICWQHGPALLLGAYPVLKLLLISGIGGVITFALALKKGDRVAGAFSGLFIGAGAAGGFVLYTSLFHRLSLSKGEIMLAELVGALPGFLLLACLTRRRRKPKDDNTAAPPVVQNAVQTSLN